MPESLFTNHPIIQCHIGARTHTHTHTHTHTQSAKLKVSIQSGGIASPFLTSKLSGGEWSGANLCHFIPRELGPDTHCIGCWVGPRAGMDSTGGGESLAPAGNRTLIPQLSSLQPSCYTDRVILGLRETTRNFSRAVGAPTKSQTGHLPNTSQKHYHLFSFIFVICSNWNTLPVSTRCVLEVGPDCYCDDLTDYCSVLPALSHRGDLTAAGILTQPSSLFPHSYKTIVQYLIT
jgi:hypothetical protein